MAEWKKVQEDGQEFYINEELGNVIKAGDKYISLFPKMLKIGPFKNLDEAQRALVRASEMIEEFELKFNDGVWSATLDEKK